MASTPKIAIIGAGPAGLTLTRILSTSNVQVDFTIYELDASPTARPDQGGSLDLHTDTGLAAIRKCGLWDAFQEHARYEGEEIIFCDENFTQLVHVSGGTHRPEIDRLRLKELLLASVPAACIRWGRHLREVTADGRLRFDGQVELEGPFDLVVGADGAWSKVRPQLHGVEPVYAGVSGYELTIQDPPRTCPHVDKMAGRGSFIGSSSDSICLSAQRMGDNSLKVRSWYTCAESAAKEALDKYGKQGALEKILERHASWAPEMLELLRQADVESLKHWTLYELPVGTKWEHKKGFTLIGDSASLATPFAGEGVNKAMKDALQLAELIVKSQDAKADITLDRAVELYEQEMFPRAEKLQSGTMYNKELRFGPTAPIGMIIGMVEKQMASENSSISLKMLGPPTVAIFYSYLWIRQQTGWAVRRFWRRT